MDENHQSPNLKNLKHFIRSHQKTTKFLLSVSVFSIFFSQSTFHSNFSSLPVKLITHTIDKNFMFLFCNGLLVLLANYSRLTTTATTSPPSKQNLSNDDYLKRYDQDVQQMRSQISLVDERMVERNGELEVEREYEVSDKDVEPEEQRVLEEEEEEEEEEEVQQQNDVQQEEKDREEEQEEAAAEVTHHETLTEEEEEEEEEEDFGEEEEKQVEEKEEASAALLSTEELNKKFDEFIRKMKEELRIEARHEQQLIMV